MGWTGKPYYGKTRKERLERMTEVYNWEDEERKIEVVDAVLVGTTAYCAIRETIKSTGKTSVLAAVILSHMEKKNMLYTKEISETFGPCERACPKRILDKLTETKSEWALEWREHCRENLKKKKSNLDHNVIPRKFQKIIGELLIRTTANNEPNEPVTVYQRSYGYVLVNDKTGYTYRCPVSLLRNIQVFRINQILV